MINKPNQCKNEISSYWTNSVLTTFSKLFEKLFLEWLLATLESVNLISNHLFGFTQGHDTIKQGYLIVSKFTNGLENNMPP